MEKRPGDEVDLGYVHIIPLKIFGVIVCTPILYETLRFRDWRGAASLCHINRATTTVFMCDQKPYPV